MTLELQKYPYLAAGDTVGVIALSSGCHPDRFRDGITHLEKMGFKPLVMLEPSRYYGKKDFLFSSDSPERRVGALYALYRNPDVRAVLAVRGAYGCMEMLPLLDFDIFRRNPKPLIGFSDTTALLNALYVKAGIHTIHGPSLEASFAKAEAGDDSARTSCERLVTLLTGHAATPEGPYLSTAEEIRHDFGPADSSGPLVGGNLAVLCSLLGTAWDFDSRGHVIFLEEFGEKPYRVHRMLLQLKLAGKFEECRGVILGSFRDCVHAQGLGPDLNDVFRDIFGNPGFPVLSGARFGHENPNLPMPLGALADIKDGRLTIESIFH